VALYLREVGELTYAQIAHALTISVDAMGVLLHRGRRALARSYAWLESEPDARCEQARAEMPVVMDGEHTKVQQRALQTHVRACDACRIELTDLQAASGAYKRLPLVAPAPLMAGKIIASAGVPASGGAGAGLPSWLAALAATNAPSLGVVAITVAVGVGAAVASTETPNEPATGPQAVTLQRAHTGPDAGRAPDVASTPSPAWTDEGDEQDPAPGRPTDGASGDGAPPATTPVPPGSALDLAPGADAPGGSPPGGPLETLLGGTTGVLLEGTQQTVEEVLEVVDETLEVVDETLELVEATVDVVEDVPALDEPLPPLDETVDDIEEIVEEVLDTLFPTPTPGPSGGGSLLRPLLP
jgi:hypothetical protein